MPWGCFVTTDDDQVWCGKVYLRSVKSVSVAKGLLRVKIWLCLTMVMW